MVADTTQEAHSQTKAAANANPLHAILEANKQKGLWPLFHYIVRLHYVLREKILMKSKFRFLILTLALICQSSTFAQGLPEDASPVRVLRAALGLNQDQVTALNTLLRERAAAIKSTNDQVHLLQEELEGILQGDAPDPLEVGELVLAIRMERAEIGQHHAQFQEAFRSLLTPRQIERIGHIHRIAMANRAAEALRQLRLR